MHVILSISADRNDGKMIRLLFILLFITVESRSAMSEDQLHYGWRSLDRTRAADVATADASLERISLTAPKDLPTPTAADFPLPERDSQYEAKHQADVVAVDEILQLTIPTEDDSLQTAVGKMIPATAFVLFLATVGILLLFKRNRFTTLRNSTTRGLRIVESLPLSGRGMLHLVAAGSDRYLVAIDPAGVKALTLVPNWPSIVSESDQETSLLAEEGTRHE